ncbi:aldose 1-epimerase family protein [bacterium 210820-DFI.6.37]|nr:aldose 1-epimerase family protein [bacterium 210820-DFI.6.37]
MDSRDKAEQNRSVEIAEEDMFYKDGIKGEAVLEYVGNMRAMAGAQELEYTQGKARGTRVIEVRNGTGIELKVLPDKAMDITDVYYRGIPMAWTTKNGVTAPWYFENSLKGFLRSWDGGLLNTCGLTSAGNECADGIEVCGIHGRISHTPVERYSIEEGFEGDAYVTTIYSTVKETAILKEYLQLDRKMTLRSDKDAVMVKDIVTNKGYEPTEYMHLYHVNYGYPLISPATKIYTSAESLEPVMQSEGNQNIRFDEHYKPQPGYPSECFKHNMPRNKDWVYVVMDNPILDICSYVKYSPKQMPYLNEWKLFGRGDYTTALEIGTAQPLGRYEARRMNQLITLQEGETRTYEYEIGFAQGREAVEKIIGESQV